MLFQSVGSRYSLGDALYHLVAIGSKKDTARLKNELAKHYKGEVALYRKGRAALAEAIRIATGGSGKVAINAFTCYSVVQAVEAAGCTPVYVEIERDSLHFSAGTLKNAFKTHPDIRAVVIQNSLGIPADSVAIEQVASAHRALLIEDLAHSAGARYDNGEEVGMVGDITMLSLGRDKALDTVNGGVLIVRRPELIVQMREPHAKPSIINQLRDRIYPLLAWKTRALFPFKIGKYILAVAYKTNLAVRSADGEVDTNEAMTAATAKHALLEFAALSEMNQQRQALRNIYKTELAEYIVPGALGNGTAAVRIPLYVTRREQVLARLKAAGYFVEDVWYDRPVSPARLYHKVHFPEAEFPVTMQVTKDIINLPTHRNVRPEHIKEMADIIRGAEK